MGDLHWRAKGGRLGCRRGWVRILGLAAFVLVGYFALYGWLRASGELRIVRWERMNDGDINHTAEMWDRVIASHNERRGFSLHTHDKPTRWLVVMWTMGLPMKLEVALDRCGWLPWTEVKKFQVPPTYDFNEPQS